MNKEPEDRPFVAIEHCITWADARSSDRGGSEQIDKDVKQARAELEAARELLEATETVKAAFIRERGRAFEWNKYFVVLDTVIARCRPAPKEKPGLQGSILRD